MRAHCTAVFHKVAKVVIACLDIVVAADTARTSDSRIRSVVPLFLSCALSCGEGATIIAGVVLFLRHGLGKALPYGTYTSPPSGIVFLARTEIHCKPVSLQMLILVDNLALFFAPPSFA